MKNKGNKMADNKLLLVDIQLHGNSQPIKYANVKDVYQKGDLICIYLDGGILHKYPIDHIFRIVQDYGYSGKGRK